MSGGPFRELFVDAGEAIAEALRAAVRAKLEPTYHADLMGIRPSRTTLVYNTLSRLLPRLCDQYQFSEIRIWRDDTRADLVFVALGLCGHKAWSVPHRVVDRVSEIAIEASDDLPSLVGAVFARMRSKRCSCESPAHV